MFSSRFPFIYWLRKTREVYLNERPDAINMMVQSRFTGHETFPCRYPWLPKAVTALQKDSDLFKDIDQAIVVLGVGKQMARAMKFWVEAAKVVEKQGKSGLKVSPLGEELLGKNGFDPYLEDIQTLWLIHWNFSTHRENPIFAWDYMMNRWQDPEIVPSRAVDSFKEEADSLNRKLSIVTLKQHFNIFLHTYVPTRGTKRNILEDNLDCPLIELNLIRQIGETASESDGKREPLYAFNRDPKPQVSQQIFFYCLDNFWKTYYPEEKSLEFREVTSGHGSPGQIFKLSEQEIRDRLEDIEDFTDGAMRFRESTNLKQIQKQKDIEKNLLRAIYQEGT